MDNLNLNSMHIYVRFSRQHNTIDRINYVIQRQGEKFICSAGNHDMVYWHRLALECDRAAKNCKQGSSSTQAREAIVYIPNEFLEYKIEEQKDILEDLAERIRHLTGTDCIIACHNSHPNSDDLEGNAHLHILISERPLLHKDEIKLADRDLFFDENNHKQRTKAAILDEFGQLRKGCYIIPKGEVVSLFGSKYSDMKSPRWTRNMKQHLCNWINETFEPDKERVVYSSDSPFVVQQHVGKECSKEVKQRIREDNIRIKKYNQYIREGIISVDEAMWYKPLIMSAPQRGLEAEAVYMALFNEDYPEEFAITEFMGTAERTSKPLTAEELNKRELRRLYRSAHIERTLARTSSNDEEKRKHQRLARHYSAEIDRMHKELGHWNLARYDSEFQKDKAELEALQTMIEETKYRISVYASQPGETSLARYRAEKRTLLDLYVAEKSLTRQIAKNRDLLKKGSKDDILKIDFSKRLESAEARRTAKTESFKDHTVAKEMVLYSCNNAQAIIDSAEIQQKLGIQSQAELIQSIEFFEKNLVRLKESLARNEDLEEYYRNKKLQCEQSELCKISKCIDDSVKEQERIKQLLALRESEYMQLKRAAYGDDVYHGFDHEEFQQNINYSELFEKHKPKIDYNHKEY